MRVAIVGAGPTGLYLSVAIARRGHEVTVIDRDAGPNGHAWWQRKGVMQFHHPHVFRLQVIEALRGEMPEVWDGLLAAGAVTVTPPGQPNFVVALRCRRMAFERVLRSVAVAEPGVRLLTGHADAVSTERDRATGVQVGEHTVPADLVIDASGRAGRLTRTLRRAPEGGDCGISYVSRQYQLLPDADEGPTNAPPGLVTIYNGYLAIVFPHDNRVFSTLIARSSSDHELAGLRLRAAFEAATEAIPPLALWTHPDRSHPITDVLPGGHLYNSYRGQLDDRGGIPLPGLIAIGDAVCTTNPALGRGVATSLMQARRLLDLLDRYGRDFVACALEFDEWCTHQIKPWFTDHVYTDAQLQRRWAGEDVDLGQRLPSDLIIAATEGRPEFVPAVGPYLAMRALPDSLDAIEPQIRDLYAQGRRPPTPLGPSRDELADLVAEAMYGARYNAGERAVAYA